MNRLAVGAWILGTVIAAALVTTRLIAFGFEQKTLFDTFLLVLACMSIFFGALLAWQLWVARRAKRPRSGSG